MNFRYFFGLLSFLTVCLCFIPTLSAQTRVDLSIGLKGGVQMSATSEVPELTFQEQVAYGRIVDDTGFYPGFGIGPGFGLALEARFWEVVGLETGLYYMFDNVTGWNDKKINGNPVGRVIMEQQSRALHIPVLLKGVAKTETIKPFLGIGFEFVFQQESSLKYRAERENPNNPSIDLYPDFFNKYNKISTSIYTLLQLTTGIEVDLGKLRIPVEIRAGYNLGWDDSLEARIEASGSPGGPYTFTSNGQDLAHFGFFTGVLYDYDFML